MYRRDFLKTLAALTAASGIGLSLDVLANDNLPLALQQLLLTYANKDYTPKKLAVTGSWPKDLEGTLYRNGPALFSRNGVSQQHWFDGDGMVHAYRMQAGQVMHQAKYVKTVKFQREEQANQFLYTTAGTDIPNSAEMENNDSVNQANTSIRRIGDKYYALWEAGSAYEIDPDNLTTKGIKTLAPELQHLPFSAHPIEDVNGDWWNIGSLVNNGVAKVVIYQLDAQGNLKRYQLVDLPQAGYMHAFAISQRYIVLLNTACVYQEKEVPFIDRFTFQEQGSSQLMLVDKNTLTLERVIDIPANFVFHFGQAYEQQDELFVSFSEYRNADIMLAGMGLNKTDGLGESHYQSRWVRYVVNLKTGKYQKIDSGVGMEFPQYDLSTPYQAQTIYGAGTLNHPALAMSNALVSMNAEMKLQQSYTYQEGIVAEEPLVVRSKAGKSYILQTIVDVSHKAGSLQVFDSQHIYAGPIATAVIDRPVVPGFHGSFIDL